MWRSESIPAQAFFFQNQYGSVGSTINFVDLILDSNVIRRNDNKIARLTEIS